MRQVIGLLMIAGLVYLGKTLFDRYQAINLQQSPSARPGATTASTSAVLPGMPASLEPSLQAAQNQGPAAMREWLRKYRHHIRDPRLAAIELDYVVLVSRHDPDEARRVFRQVRQRTPPHSPVYERVKKLENTFK
jgi:hypothetical protein